jgi:hypothetical protein
VTTDSYGTSSSSRVTTPRRAGTTYEPLVAPRPAPKPIWP